MNAAPHIAPPADDDVPQEILELARLLARQAVREQIEALLAASTTVADADGRASVPRR